jgi:predicted nucleic acid-binding protein
MPKVTYDTNVLIDYKPSYFPTGFYMSAVVIQEIAAGARDAKRLKEIDTARRYHEREGRLLIPTGEDWWIAGKILNSLYRVVRRHGQDSEPTPEQMRIVRDVLIARTAKRAGATVVTKNLSDFERIRRFCAVRLVHPDDFFSS